MKGVLEKNAVGFLRDCFSRILVALKKRAYIYVLVAYCC